MISKYSISVYLLFRANLTCFRKQIVLPEKYLNITCHPLPKEAKKEKMIMKAVACVSFSCQGINESYMNWNFTLRSIHTLIHLEHPPKEWTAFLNNLSTGNSIFSCDVHGYFFNILNDGIFSTLQIPPRASSCSN